MANADRSVHVELGECNVVKVDKKTHTEYTLKFTIGDQKHEFTSRYSKLNELHSSLSKDASYKKAFTNKPPKFAPKHYFTNFEIKENYEKRGNELLLYFQSIMSRAAVLKNKLFQNGIELTDELKELINSIADEHEKSVRLKTYSTLLNMGFSDKISMKAASLYLNDINEAISAAINTPGDVEEKTEQKQLNNDNDEEIMHQNVIDTKGQYYNMNNDKKTIHHNVMDTKGNMVNQKNQSKVSKDIIQNKSDEMKAEVSCDGSIRKQFHKFLKGMSLEKYMDKFKENDCCDMESIEFYDDDFLKTDIGIKSQIARKKFLAKCSKMKLEMDEFKNGYGITSILYERLAKYGIVTISILCDEIKRKNDLKYKYKITNENQCNLLWNVIQKQENLNQDMTEMNEAEGQ
eukprot:344334_1